jgi:hypothetical protein
MLATGCGTIELADPVPHPFFDGGTQDPGSTAGRGAPQPYDAGPTVTPDASLPGPHPLPGPDPVFCPAIACIAGAEVDAPFDYGFESARGLLVTACLNDTCYTGSFPLGLEDPRVSALDPMVLPTQGGSDLSVQITLEPEQDGSLHVNATWTPAQQSQLASGDRYRLLAVDRWSNLLVNVDETVYQYDQHVIGGGQCEQRCTWKTITATRGGCEPCDAGL